MELVLTFGVLVFACLTWLVLGRLVGLTCTCLLTIEPATTGPELLAAPVPPAVTLAAAVWPLATAEEPAPAVGAVAVPVLTEGVAPPPCATLLVVVVATTVVPAAGGRGGGCISEAAKSPAPPTPTPPVELAAVTLLVPVTTVVVEAPAGTVPATVAVVTCGAISCCGDGGYFEERERERERERRQLVVRRGRRWPKALLSYITCVTFVT